LELREIEKSGAIFSTVGIALLMMFVIVLLVYPIIKQCQSPTGKCEFYSTAPDPIKFIVKTNFLVTALTIIAIGLGITRLAIWYEYKK
jgi:hypothetical protein